MAASRLRVELASRWHGWVLRRYAELVGYRHRDRLTDPLQVPGFVAKLTLDQIRSKASTSLNAAAIFLAISVAVLVAVMSSDSFAKVVAAGKIGWSSVATIVVTIASLVLVVRQERMINAPETKTNQYVPLVFYLAFAGALLIVVPLIDRLAFLLTGLSLIVTSTLFLFAAVELYDYASGWVGGEEEPGKLLHFHLAGLASNSYLFGVSFALLGASLLLAQIAAWVGAAASLLVLLALFFVPEIERGLYTSKGEGTSTTAGL